MQLLEWVNDLLLFLILLACIDLAAWVITALWIRARPKELPAILLPITIYRHWKRKHNETHP